MGNFDSIHRSMNQAGKYIGINQPISISVLDHGLIQFLKTGSIDKLELKQLLSQFTKGENRLDKSTFCAYKILNKPSVVLKYIKDNISLDSYIRLSTQERNALLISLISISFPFAYHLLLSMAASFKYQTTINKNLILTKISSLYGSNRAMYIGVDSVLPMFIELNLIKRSKISIYEPILQKFISIPILKEILVYTDILLSGSKSVLVDDIRFRPWYYFFPIEFTDPFNSQLLYMKEEQFGNGYIFIDSSKENESTS